LKDSRHQSSIEKWTEELVFLQPEITQYRELALKKLEPFLDQSAAFLLKEKDISIEFSSGFPRELNMSYDAIMDYYRSKLNYDLAIKRTSVGVHKANLKFLINNVPAEKSASRGQLKLLSIALLLAQSSVIKKTNEKGKNHNGIILIDDFTSELDSLNEKSLVNYLSQLDQQIIITTASQFLQNDILSGKMFHVKHGEVMEVKC